MARLTLLQDLQERLRRDPRNEDLVSQFSEYESALVRETLLRNELRKKVGDRNVKKRATGRDITQSAKWSITDEGNELKDVSFRRAELMASLNDAGVRLPTFELEEIARRAQGLLDESQLIDALDEKQIGGEPPQFVAGRIELNGQLLPEE